MAITEDASTPAIATVSDAGTSTASTKTITSASFSPPANTLLVALVNGGWGNSATNAEAASVTDSVGGTWTAGPAAVGTNTSARGVGAVFYRYLSSAPGAMTVTATVTNMCGGRQLAVRVLNGAASNQTGAGTGTSVFTTATTSGTVSVTTTVTGSVVYGVNDNCGNASAFTASGTTSVLASGDFNDTADTVRLVSWKATSATGTPGATTFGVTWTTAAVNNVAAMEILPQTSTTFSGSANLAGVGALTANATVIPGAPHVAMAAVAALTVTPIVPVIPQFPAIPRDVAVELFLNNTWLDATSDVRAAAGIDITRGRPNEASASQPSTCAMTFDNRSGNYSPRNPVGAYYGQIGRNTPIRVAVGLATDTFTRTVTGGWGNADTGQTWTATNTGALIPAGFGVGGGVGTHSMASATDYRYTTLGTPGWRDVEVAATFTLPFTTVTGASVFPGSVILRWQNPTAGWYTVQPRIDTNGHVMLGMVYGDGSILTAFVDTGIIHSSSQALRVRAQIEGQTLRGKIWPAAGSEPYRWQVTANDVSHPTAGAIGILSTTAAGNTNTYPMVFSYDNVKVRSPRFFGEVASWPQRWDTAGIDITAPIEAAGVTRRLGQGQSPVSSTLFRGETNQSPLPKAYWPCEDGADSAFIVSGIGGPPMSINTITSPAVSNSATATTKFAAYTGFVASAPIPTVGATTTWVGVVPTYTATNSATISFITNIGATAIVDAGTIATLKMAGSNTTWRIRYRTLPGPPVIVGDLSVTVDNASGTNIHDSGPIAFAINEQNILIKLSVTQNGTGVDYNIATLQVGQDVAQFVAHTVASTTVTQATQVVIAEFGELPTTPIGHIGVVDYVGSAFDLAIQLKAYSGETALARIKRLCTQISVPLSYFGDLSGNALTDTTLMGAQHVDTALNIITECANTELGTLTEPRGDTGLLYRTRASLYNQYLTALLDYMGGQVAPPFQPVDDDQLTRNDLTVTRRDGTFATAALLTGRMSILDPSAGGVGIYDTAVTVNVATDDQLPDIAGWLLNVGTVDQTRYPQVRVDLANPKVSADPALTAGILDLAVDDFFQIVNPKPGQTPDEINLIARGYSEHISTFEHSITINAAPEVPYDIARLDTPGAKFATTGSTLTGGVTATATSLSVATASGALWTTSPAAMPILITVGGERMNVTAVTGTTSPQTFTVTRSVNGVVKTQTAGTAVQLSFPLAIPL